MMCPTSINGATIEPGCYVAGMLNDAVGKDGIVKEIALDDGGWRIVVYLLPNKVGVWYARPCEVYCFDKRPSSVIMDAVDKATFEFDLDKDPLRQAVRALAMTGR